MAKVNAKTESAKYKDMIFPDEKSVKNDEKLEAIEDAQVAIDAAIAAAKKSLRAATKQVELAKRTVPFSPVRVLETSYTLRNAQEDLEGLEALKEELF